jgi:glycyl-tRNA synthetase beta chain
MSADKPKDLLLEIGVEELPARFVGPGLASLKALAEKALQDAGLSFKSAKALGTPRRLALLVEALSPKAQDRTHEALGPGLSQAKDKDGNWTPAAQGFARSQGVAPEQLQVKETEKGPRLAFSRKETGLPAEKILPALLPELIRKLPFPKNMVWEESRLSFPRPIRWIAALHGAQVVKFSLAGVKSGNKTLGLRIHGKKPLPVAAPAKYVALLKDRLVAVDPAERRALVEKQIQLAVKPVKGHVPVEKYGDLVEEVTNLVEHPVALLGEFDPKLLELPAEVLVTSMKKHQKYFPVFDGEGRLLPRFVGVRNGISENQAVVKEGYQRVLAARLSDAAFFHREDRKTTLEEKAPLLKGVLFQKALGSVWEKVERTAVLADALGVALKLSPEERAEAVSIVRLGKADLVSAMVGEFPELQGVMGRIYARAEGKPEGVALGIEQHYWPLSAEGVLPETAPAALASLADKLDTLAGDFLVGLVPTGSQDPYGLRRAAVGVLRLIEARGWRLGFKAAAERALAAFPESVKGDRAGTLRTLLDFFRQRWSALLEAEGFRVDEISAVTAAGFDDAVDARARLKALSEVRRHPDFEPLAAAYKRAFKIVKQAEKAVQVNWGWQALPIREDFLAEGEERALFALYLNLREAAGPLLAEARYAEVTKLLVRFRDPVDRFFEKVMVMAPDEGVRANRISLLANVVKLFRAVADLSQLQDVPGK